jgi:putative hydrolase of the HAD superfamily
MNRPVVLLDADGVFLRTIRPGNYLEHRYGLTAAQTAGFQKFMSQCLVGKADLKPELPRFLKEWGISETPEMFLDEAFGSGSEIDASVANVVKGLREEGIFCGLATNQDKHRMQYLDQRLAIRRHFDATFVSCELGVRKPEAEYFQTVQASFPGKTLAFWDDRPENVQAAKECGWSAFVFENVATLLAEVKNLQKTG